MIDLITSDRIDHLKIFNESLPNIFYDFQHLYDYMKKVTDDNN